MFSLRINTMFLALMVVLAVAVTVVMGQITGQNQVDKPVDVIKRRNNDVVFITLSGKRIQLPQYKTTRHKTRKGWDRIIFEMTDLSENNQYAVYTRKDYVDTIMHGMMKETISLLDAYGQKKWSKEFYFISDGKINEADPNAEYILVWLSNNGRMALATYLDYDTTYHMQAYVIILENTGQELYRSKIEDPYIDDYRRDDMRLISVNYANGIKIIDAEMKKEIVIRGGVFLHENGNVVINGVLYKNINEVPDTVIIREK